MTVFCNIQDNIKNIFQSIQLPYLPKYNACIFPVKQVFVSIYIEQFAFLLSAFFCLFFTSEYRIVPEVYKLIPGSTQPSTWLQLNKLLMKLWKGVSRAFTLLFRSKFGDDSADHRGVFFC
jgi:hypothetical protein